VLCITAAHHGSKISHVPSDVYIAVISIQSIGGLATLLITDPPKIRRNDGRPIAHFKHRSWKDELAALLKTILTPQFCLLSLALLGSQAPFSLASSLNAFYFNARTRALANVSFPEYKAR
jgi:hypothetical protein